MKIIKKINTSAAIALDSLGNEIVVLGKGIGFPPVPYELKDLSQIDRTFYDVDSKYFSLIKELPQDILEISAEISEMAEKELNAQMNPNLPFTLADHLNFSVERLKKGIDMTGAIAYDIRHLYPKETKIGEKALQLFKNKMKITLPASEAVGIAMHLINAELKVDDISAVFSIVKITNEIKSIVENNLKIQLDESSYEYSRFLMHLRYLIQRISNGSHKTAENEILLDAMLKEYPSIGHCADEIIDYLEGTWGWSCNKDEKLYLMLHINRVSNLGA